MTGKRKWSVLVIGGVVMLLVGLLTAVAMAQDATPEAQAEDQPQNGNWLPFGGFGHRGGLGRFGGMADDRDENLAEALGITVEELQAAREQAFRESITDAVAAGRITQEQADLLLAMQAIRGTIDRQALLAEALGMTVDEVEAARSEGQTLWDLMFEKEISPSELQTKMQAAYEAAVQQAVADGVITQEQADAILSSGMRFFGGHGRGHHGWGGFRGFGAPGQLSPDTAVPETTDTSFDA